MGLLRNAQPHNIATIPPELAAPMMKVLPTFRSVEKTFAEVVQLLMTSERLGKLLYYSDRHCENMVPITPAQFMSMLNEQIRIVPRIPAEDDVKPYIVITMDNFVPEIIGSEFRSAVLSFDILSSYEYWLLDDFRLRPYAIAGEIDGLLNGKKLQGRTAEFIGANQMILDRDFGGLSLLFHLDTSFDDNE